MRIALRLLLVALGAYLVQRFAPWWSVAIVGFCVGLLLSERRRKRIFETRRVLPAFSFLAGFLAVGVVWGLLAFLADTANASLLSAKIAQLVVNGDAPPAYGNYYLLAATALIGGLVGGFATMTGNLLGEAIKS